MLTAPPASGHSMLFLNTRTLRSWLNFCHLIAALWAKHTGYPIFQDNIASQ